MSNCPGLPLVHFYRSSGTSINSLLHTSALFPNFIGYKKGFNFRIKQVSIPVLGSPSPKRVFRGNKMWETPIRRKTKGRTELRATHVAGDNDTWDSTVEKRYVLFAITGNSSKQLLRALWQPQAHSLFSISSHCCIEKEIKCLILYK